MAGEGTELLTLHQRLNEFQNHVLHVTALMLPFSGSFGIWLKTHLPDKFPELVTVLLILLSPRGSAAAEREAGAGSLQGWALHGPHGCPWALALPWAPEQGEQHKESPGAWNSRLCGGSSSLFSLGLAMSGFSWTDLCHL